MHCERGDSDFTMAKCSEGGQKIGVLSWKEHNDAQSLIMYGSVGGGLHVREYVHVSMCE